MKFSIVTPSFNSERFISETIKSVLNQRGNFEIEYILVDGKSTDSTLQIIDKYKKLVSDKKWNKQCNNITVKIISEKDKGMYDAINKGFQLATGDIHAYINSDDTYLPNAFSTIQNHMNNNPKIQWIKGITSYINEGSIVFQSGVRNFYNQNWIKRGFYGRYLYFIQQDSVFWKANLWKKAGPIDPSLKLAGDYDLWIKFANHSKLHSINSQVSCFRKRKGQLSEQNQSYQDEMKIIAPKQYPIFGIFLKVLNKIIQTMVKKSYTKT